MTGRTSLYCGQYFFLLLFLSFKWIRCLPIGEQKKNTNTMKKVKHEYTFYCIFCRLIPLFSRHDCRSFPVAESKVYFMIFLMNLYVKDDKVKKHLSIKKYDKIFTEFIWPYSRYYWVHFCDNVRYRYITCVNIFFLE